MSKFLVKQNWKSIVTVWLLALGLVTGVQIVKVNLDNRSKADEEDVYVSSDVDQIEDMCGEADKLPALSRPIDNLCKVGSPVWIDSVASGGLYRWECIDDVSGGEGECSAVLSN